MTLLGMPFATEEKVATYTHKMGEAMETLVIKFNQQMYEEFLSSGLASPIAT